MLIPFWVWEVLVSKYVLDCKRFHETYTTGVTWENSDLRTWLNNDFKNTAFSADEQKKIPVVSLANKGNTYWKTKDKNNTNDQVFCLSVEEMEAYFGGYDTYDSEKQSGANSRLMCKPTKYASNNSWISINKDDGDCFWWLRTDALTQYFIIGGCSSACYVYWHGWAGPYYYNGVCSPCGVRPAIYIKKTIEPTSIKLNKTSATMFFGNEITLSATLAPSDVTEKTITWTSSNTAVATVNNGKVKANNKGGETTITAKTVNGLTATCKVTVYADNNPSNIFADIKYGSWQYNAAKAVYDKGYMTGKGNLNGRVLFSPDTNMTRSQFVVSLYSMDGKPAVTYEQRFSDVKSGDWYASAVTWAVKNGITAGNKNGKFGVDGKATREQIALMFYKYAVYKGYDVSIKATTNLDGFTDASKVDSWAVEAIKWAVERGIISGKGNATDGYRIAPTSSATRIECAAMMNKFSEVYSGAPKMGDEDLEEPLALPEENIEDLPMPSDEMEEVIVDEEEEDEDVPSEDEKDTDEEDTVE